MARKLFQTMYIIIRAGQGTLWLPRKRVELTVQKSMVGAGKPSVHCHPGSVVSIFTCESSSLLYTFAINIVAVTLGFVISFLSKKSKLF